MPDLQHPRFACDESFPGRQVLRLARRAIERYRLDLRGLRVLTEASTGYRRATPVIAALAGADEVYAIGRDTAQAARKEAEAQTAYLAGKAHAIPELEAKFEKLFDTPPGSLPGAGYARVSTPSCIK